MTLYFKILNKSFLAPRFQASFGKLYDIHSRSGFNVAKELVLASELTDCSILLLEKNWITEYPKAIALTSFI